MENFTNKNQNNEALKLSRKAKTLEKKAERAYEYLFEIRKLDAQLFYMRNTVFLLIEGWWVTLISTNLGKHPSKLAILCFGGCLISCFWLKIIKSSLEYLKHWKNKLKKIEPNVLGKINVFREDAFTNAGITLEPIGETFLQLIYISYAVWFFIGCFFVMRYLLQQSREYNSVIAFFVSFPTN